MTTPAKLYGKDLSAYDEVDVDELLAQLSAEEIKILAKEVDPDVRQTNFYFSLFLLLSTILKKIFIDYFRITFCRPAKEIIMIVKKIQPAR